MQRRLLSRYVWLEHALLVGTLETALPACMQCVGICGLNILGLNRFLGRTNCQAEGQGVQAQQLQTELAPSTALTGMHILLQCTPSAALPCHFKTESHCPDHAAFFILCPCRPSV
jgi:hypothetical protein